MNMLFHINFCAGFSLWVQMLVFEKKKLEHAFYMFF